MEVLVLAARVPEDFETAVRDDLVGVHVRARARTALDEVDHEMLVMLAIFDLRAGLRDRVCLGFLESAETLVGTCCRVLDVGECSHERREMVEAEVRDPEVFEGPEGLNAVKGVGGNFAVSEQVMLDAHVGHVMVHVLVVRQAVLRGAAINAVSLA